MKIYSFDKANQAAKRETIPFEKYGKQYSIPAKMPAGVVLEFHRLQEDGVNIEENMPEGSMFKIFRYIFTDKVVEELLECGLSVEEMGQMLTWAIKCYNPKTDAEESPKAEVENEE